MENTCVLCEATKSDEFIVSDRGKGKVVCAECLDELQSKRGILAGDVRAVHQKIKTVTRAAQKGVETFKDELDR